MTPAQEPTKAWHAQDGEQVLAAVKSDRKGLASREAGERLQQQGYNRLTPIKKKGPLARFVAQFHNVLIYVLLAAAGLTAFLQHWVDTGVILGVVLINAVIGFLQEGKAEKALDAIRNILSLQAMVRRDGRSQRVDAGELVVGDIVLLQSGDKVPADLRLLWSKELRIDEALLTGESVPAEKSTAPVFEAAPIGDRVCMAYSGTFVASGQGEGVVVATGDRSEIGRISGLLGQVEHLATPLTRQLKRFGQWLSLAIVGLAAVTFIIGTTWRGYSASEMFLAAVGLAVAAIPEGLPAIVTITLAIGVERMARRRAIIRRLPAVEALGSVSVICSDKTGTLTRNEMTVQSVATATGLFSVSGVGYDPHGTFRFNDRDEEINPDDFPVLHELARAGILCNDAGLNRTEEGWRIEGDPTEGSLLTLGMKAGLDIAYEQSQWARTDVIPFESEHKFMASLHHDRTGHGFIYIKGAPEVVLEMCTCQRMRGEDVVLDPVYWHEQMTTMASRGHRLLAIAFKSAAADHQELRFSDVESGLTLLGIVGIIDPPRTAAIKAVEQCRQAGIKVKMITGDHALTASAIAAQMGIGDGRRVLTGSELNRQSDEALREVVHQADVFARTSPEHKLRLVQALQAQGEVVVMTGDGVNDAPALKRADVGVAMGLKGTEVSKEAAEMVLTDDNFASIAHAVEEGRTVYDNLKKAILFILPTNGGEALTLLAAIALGRALPITPVQILWINMITAVTLALALAFEPAESDVMQRRPRDPAEPLLSRLLVWRIIFVSLIIVAGTFSLFLWYRQQGAGLEESRTVAVNTLVMFEIFYLFCARYLNDFSLSPRKLIANNYALLAVAVLLLFQLAFTYAPPMQVLFGTAAISARDWLTIVIVASSVLWLVELEKWLLRRSEHSLTS